MGRALCGRMPRPGVAGRFRNCGRGRFAVRCGQEWMAGSVSWVKRHGLQISTPWGLAPHGHVYVCTHARICIHKYAMYMEAQIIISIHKHSHVCKHVYMYKTRHVIIFGILVYVKLSAGLNMCEYRHVHMHTSTHAHMDACTHVHTHTHKRERAHAQIHMPT